MVNREEKISENKNWAIRETLFGDMPLSAWTGKDSNDEPWIRFQAVEAYLGSGNTQMATQVLREIIETPNLESRHTLQAWHFLKSLGVDPPDDKAKQVYGVIVEVTMKQGVDILAAYADHSALYLNYSGTAVIWEHPDNSLKGEIDRLLDAGKNIIGTIGPWKNERPDVPPQGQARVCMLTPSGLHFGQAPLNVLANDSMGGPIIQAATDLMGALVKKRKQNLA
jgi:hypothetical protein